MAITRAKKEETLTNLTELFQKAKTVVFSQYKGTKVKDMRTLRHKMHEQQVSFKVAKKTLMRLAAKQIGLGEIPEEFMQGPVGLAFGMKDEITPARLLHEFGRDHETLKIVGAIFEGKFLSSAEAKAIATLPTREILLTKLVRLFKSPVSGFHAVLYGLLRNFVYTLAEIQRKKPA